MTKDKNIFIKNIYYMLSYAFTALNFTEYSDIAAERFDNVHNLFAAILAKGVGQQLRQGLCRGYTGCEEDMPLLRGKINMPGTLKDRATGKRLISCRYDVLSENVLFNRILKTTVMLLIRHPGVEAAYKSVLKKEMMYFAEVDEISPDSVRWSEMHFRRGSQTYRMLIGICRFVLEGMLLTTDKGEYRLASFADEQRMCRLYEKFILEYYIREYPALNARASQIPWSLDSGAGDLLPVMQSDVTLTYGNRTLIIDAKYYAHTTQSHYNMHTLHSSNLYQIFAYVKNKASLSGGSFNDVSGMLLYAGTDESVQPNVSYMMSGNMISVRTLDLNRDFSEIAAQLNAAADELMK